jgi:hypothetical protein
MTLASCGKDAARNTEKDYTEKRGGISPRGGGEGSIEVRAKQRVEEC